MNIEKTIPSVRAVARDNRAFMVRAVRHLSELGVRQFLDIGTDVPTEPNLHQVAQETAPDARVVYVDNDPIVLAHARALLIRTPELGKVYFSRWTLITGVRKGLWPTARDR